MPTISMFYGIISGCCLWILSNITYPIFILSIRAVQAVISIPDGNLLEGDIPAKKLRMVQAWIAIHEDELMADWSLAVSGQPVFPIDPLR